MGGRDDGRAPGAGEGLARLVRDATRRPRPPAEAVDAATVVLVRDGSAGLETLMLRRSSKLAFAGGMWVFPGGRVDPGDREGPADDEFASFRRAAVREASEEAGLRVDPSTLVAFAHWTPPPITPKRFLTWFFLAPAPAGADVSVDAGEIRDHAWMRPEDALRRRDAGEIELAPPTWVTLHGLARHGDVADALAAAGGRAPERFETRVALLDEGTVALWSGDAGYESGDARTPGPRHRLWMSATGWRYERTP